MDAPDIEYAYRRYFPVIKAKCARMLGDSAEAQDLAQETFMRLWARRSGLRNDEAVLAWVYRTATRLALDRIRREQVVPSAILEDRVERTDSAARLQARQELHAVVRRLGKREREVLVLSRVDGLTHQQIGEVLRMSDRTVRRILRTIDEGSRRPTRWS